MSPQQLDGERGNHLDDIYSLGASLYEMLTSRPPFYSGNVDRQIHEKIPPPMGHRRRELEIEGGPIEEHWEAIVRQCLAKDPARRPQSVAEVAQRLNVPSPALAGRADANQNKRVSGHLLVGAGALIALIGFGALVFWIFSQRRKSHERSGNSTVCSYSSTDRAFSHCSANDCGCSSSGCRRASCRYFTCRRERIFRWKGNR